MGGRRYYTFGKGPVEFFVIDSTYMDAAQLQWLETALRESRARWKIAYGHHPLYSSGGKHGSEVDLRQLVEPLYIKYGVDVSLAGHEHFYERVVPQHGIHYFTSGSASKLRRGDIRRGQITAAGFDQDLSFMLVEIAGDTFSFRVISRSGQVVDAGTFQRPADPAPPSARSLPGRLLQPAAAAFALLWQVPTGGQNVATSEAEVTVSTRSKPGTGTLK
jgi:3',5'-cyclic AMP phosphodiesterase CpdA